MSELLDDLPTAQAEYALRNGAVGDWLVLGPLMAPLAEPLNGHSKVARQLALSVLFVEAEEITQLPAERANSTVTVAEGVTLQGAWRMVNTLEDNRVDLAQRVETPQMLCAWAYAQVVLPARIAAPLTLTVASPTQVWLNGEAIFAFDELPDQPIIVNFDATLDEGTNEILVRVANVGVGDLPMLVALDLPTAAGTVKLPTLLEPVKRRQKLAAVMDAAYLAQDVFSRDQRIVLRWPTDMQMIDALNARLQTPTGRIYGEANPMIQKGAKVDFGKASQVPDGLYEVLLQPQFEEYYVQDMRVQRRISFRVRNGEWSTVYYGSHAERRQEALTYAAGKRGDDVVVEIAKSALGQWETLRHAVIEETLTRIAQRPAGWDRQLLALLGWVARMGDLPEFPQEMMWALEERTTLLLDQMGDAEIIESTCHLLAGQLYAQRTFADLNTGEWHQTEAEARLLAWLHTTAQKGLPAGESEQGLADALIALSHLVDLAHSDEVAELAAAVLDKLAFQIAMQCFLGAWGGTQEQPTPIWLASARLGPLSGVARLWWGQGAYNRECAATVALACAEGYMLPEIIAAVGLDRQQENWLRRQDAPATVSGDLVSVAPRINRAAYRTGDYLLASMQGDWAAGTGGALWRVTMGPDALIFGNRPASSSEHAAWKLNYWGGNAAAVRVAQWQDVLVVGYGAHDDAAFDDASLDGAAEVVGLDFTHAYFPRAIFDEVLLAEGWAMARKGNGYVALTATGGVTLVTKGRTAQREVRAASQSVWLVQMGRAADDGTFAQFAERVLAQSLALEQAALEYVSLRGQSMRFRMGTPLGDALVVDGVSQALDNFPHMASIYGGSAALPASSVDIQYLEHKMRLDFGTPTV